LLPPTQAAEPTVPVQMALPYSAFQLPV
jgi:hypothetical protein